MDVSALATGDAASREAVLDALVARLLAPDAAPFPLGDDLVAALAAHTRGPTVFERSFAAECLAVVVAWDTGTGSLHGAAWREALDAVLGLARTERDLRGWVEGAGWAHAVAHLADALGELAASPRSTADDRAAVCDALALLVGRARAPFDGEEDERVALALVALVTRGGQDAEMLAGALVAQAPATPEDGAETPAARAVRVNLKHVLTAAARRTGEAAFAEAAASLARP